MIEQFGALYFINPINVATPKFPFVKRLYQSNLDNLWYTKDSTGASTLFTPGGGGGGNDVTIGTANGLSITGVLQVLSLQLATGLQNGALSAADFNTFNNKQNALGYVPEDVANKATDFTVINNILYPSVQAVENRILAAIAGWQLDGNTNGAERYIGTNDAFDFPIYTNGVEVSRYTVGGDLGVGTNTPSARVDTKGSGVTSATMNFRARNSANVSTTESYDNGAIQFGFTTYAGSAGRVFVKVSNGDAFTDGVEIYNTRTGVGVRGLKITLDGANAFNNTGIVINVSNAGAGLARSIDIDGGDFSLQNAKMVLGGFNTTADAILSLDSLTLGFLPPRLTTANKNALVTFGQLVYDSDTNTLENFNGSFWTSLQTGRQLKDFYTDVVVTGAEADIYSYSIPANTIKTNGDKIYFETVVESDAAGTTGIVRLYFGGTLVYDSTTNAAFLNAGFYKYKLFLIRTGVATARIHVQMLSGSTTVITLVDNSFVDLAGLDFTVANILKITGEDAADNITGKMSNITYTNAAM